MTETDHSQNITLAPEYKVWLIQLKAKIRSTQAKAILTVNSALINFYWELGKMIAEKQTKWGSKFLQTLSNDLKAEFSNMQGFSVTNLKYCQAFYNYYGQSISQLPVDQIPWSHNIIIFTKSEDLAEAHFYIQKTLENGWSRDTLALQVKTNLYQRNGKAITNFNQTLPPTVSDLANQTLKDPYIFDFISLTQPYQEKDIENQLVEHLTKFLLELGKGFAFLGRQYHLVVGDNDYYLDLLFYHTKLKCYVVIELKNTKFMPEYAGKLNFYLSAVDSLVKDKTDNPTIGILLCRDKNSVEAEFSLRDINKPMGVSEFLITENLPENLKSNLPTVEELENELKNL